MTGLRIPDRNPVSQLSASLQGRRFGSLLYRGFAGDSRARLDQRTAQAMVVWLGASLRQAKEDLRLDAFNSVRYSP
jgi:hypothetical protein